MDSKTLNLTRRDFTPLTLAAMPASVLLLRVPLSAAATIKICYNMNVKTTQDDEIEYAFRMAKALGVNEYQGDPKVEVPKCLAFVKEALA